MAGEWNTEECCVGDTPSPLDLSCSSSYRVAWWRSFRAFPAIAAVSFRSVVVRAFGWPLPTPIDTARRDHPDAFSGRTGSYSGRSCKFIYFEVRLSPKMRFNDCQIHAATNEAETEVLLTAAITGAPKP